MIVALVLLAAAAQALDLATFAAAVGRYGIGGEVNPVMASAYQALGLWGVAGVKAAGLLLVLLVVHAIDGASPGSWVGPAVLAFTILVGLLGAATNLWALAQ